LQAKERGALAKPGASKDLGSLLARGDGGYVSAPLVAQCVIVPPVPTGAEFGHQWRFHGFAKPEAVCEKGGGAD